MQFFTPSGSKLIFTPKPSSKSADPHLLVTALLPCFATGTPAPATIKAEIVLMLNVLTLSPPVPHVSNNSPSTLGSIRFENSLIIFANPVISSIDSPFILKAVRNAPN